MSILYVGRVFSALRTLSFHHRVRFAGSAPSTRPCLVILGTGWSSYSVLKNIKKSLYDVVVISPRNHFLFTPLLASTTVGTLEFRSIIEPVRNVGFRQSHHFHLAYADSVDFDTRQVFCENSLNPDVKYAIKYDKLVIGVGALSNTFGVPGVPENAYFLKEVSDARKIRNRILSNFELALAPGIAEKEKQRLLHMVIVGGGPTGIEFGAELYDFVEQDVSRLYRGQDKQVNVTLVESQQILGSFDERLRSFAEKKIKQRDRFHLVKSSVTEVKADGVVLANGDTIPCGLTVWSTGLAPRYFTKRLNVPKTHSGQILTDQYLQVLGTPAQSVYAVGDCADIQDYPLPCTAQVAERQGLYLAKQLNNIHKGKQEPFSHKSLGMLTYIGGYEALSDLPEFKLKGFPSWFLWRSAYLTRLGSWRLRMQVPMDWLKTLLFGRDVSRF